jgi:hypothetical protein
MANKFLEHEFDFPEGKNCLSGGKMNFSKSKRISTMPETISLRMDSTSQRPRTISLRRKTVSPRARRDCPKAKTISPEVKMVSQAQDQDSQSANSIPVR